MNKTIEKINRHLQKNNQDIEALTILGDCYSILQKESESKKYYNTANNLFCNTNPIDRDENLKIRIMNGLRRTMSNV